MWINNSDERKKENWFSYEKSILHETTIAACLVLLKVFEGNR